MFKPVTGDQLNNFDAETQQLYRRRETDQRLEAIWTFGARKFRNELPIYNSKDNPYIQEGENERSSTFWRLNV